MSEGELILALLGIMVALLSPLYMEVFKIAKQVAMLVVMYEPNCNENSGGTGAGRMDAPPSPIGGLEAVPAQGETRS